MERILIFRRTERSGVEDQEWVRFTIVFTPDLPVIG